jgi:hypothetical protein
LRVIKEIIKSRLEFGYKTVHVRRNLLLARG